MKISRRERDSRYQEPQSRNTFVKRRSMGRKGADFEADKEHFIWSKSRTKGKKKKCYGMCPFGTHHKGEVFYSNYSHPTNHHTLLWTLNLQVNQMGLSDSEKQDLHTELPLLASSETPFNQQATRVTALVLIQHKARSRRTALVTTNTENNRKTLSVPLILLRIIIPPIVTTKQA